MEAKINRDEPGVASLALPQNLHVITITTNGRERLFENFALGAAACRCLQGGALMPSQLWCWVLMPDHWRGVVELDGTDSVKGVVERLKTRTALAVNRKRWSARRVWHSEFDAHRLPSTEATLSAARSVIASPIREGIVDRMRDYPFWDAVWI